MGDGGARPEGAQAVEDVGDGGEGFAGARARPSKPARTAGGRPSTRSTSGRTRPSAAPARSRVPRKRRYDSAPSVSRTSDDFPEPLTPHTTVQASRGRSRSRFLRWWVRAPRTWMEGTAPRYREGGAWPREVPGRRAGRLRRRPTERLMAVPAAVAAFAEAARAYLASVDGATPATWLPFVGHAARHLARLYLLGIDLPTSEPEGETYARPASPEDALRAVLAERDAYHGVFEPYEDAPAEVRSLARSRDGPRGRRRGARRVRRGRPRGGGVGVADGAPRPRGRTRRARAARAPRDPVRRVLARLRRRRGPDGPVGGLDGALPLSGSRRVRRLRQAVRGRRTRLEARRSLVHVHASPILALAALLVSGWRPARPRRRAACPR